MQLPPALPQAGGGGGVGLGLGDGEGLGDGDGLPEGDGEGVGDGDGDGLPEGDGDGLVPLVDFEVLDDEPVCPDPSELLLEGVELGLPLDGSVVPGWLELFASGDEPPGTAAPEAVNLTPPNWFEGIIHNPTNRIMKTPQA